MNHFVLLSGARAASLALRAHRRLAAVGLPMKTLIEREGHIVLVRDSLAEEQQTFVVFDDDSYIVCAGMFSFEENFGRPALEKYFRSFDPKNPSLAGTLGHFTLCIRKHGRSVCLSDSMNCNKLYRNEDDSVVSSLFIGVVECLDAATPDRQGCYEYAWAMVPSGEKTFLREVATVPCGRALSPDGTPRLVPLPELDLSEPDAVGEGPERAVERHLHRLRSAFGTYVHRFGDNLSISLSGGYDSRLMLALILEAGAKPTLFTYRVAGLVDHQIAESIAQAEGLDFEIVEKSVPAHISKEKFPELVRQNYGLFDGWKVDGLFNDGVDTEDRLNRVRDGRVKVNGVLGEVYRNFFYLPKGRYSLREIVWAFYARYVPAACTTEFDPRAYEATLAGEIGRAIGADRQPLERRQVELVYPLFRGRYSVARGIPINQTFGSCLFPFVDPGVIKGTCEIDIGLKSYGRFEARLIRAISPRLAAHPSHYGFNFAADPPSSYVLKAQLSYRRPPLLRRYSYRLQYRSPGPRPFYLQPDHLGTVLDAEFPYMRRYFHLAKVPDSEVFNRVATMEYILQRVAGGNR